MKKEKFIVVSKVQFDFVMRICIWCATKVAVAYRLIDLALPYLPKNIKTKCKKFLNETEYEVIKHKNTRKNKNTRGNEKRPKKVR